MADVKVLALVGSLRAASINRQLAELAAETAPDGVTVTVFDGLGDLPFYNEDIDNEDVPASVVALREAAADADAALVVTPEYNGSIPGVLKNAIDWLSRPFGNGALKGKPAAVVGGSFGRYGGVWAHDETRKSFGIGGSAHRRGPQAVGASSNRWTASTRGRTPRSSRTCATSSASSPPKSADASCCVEIDVLQRSTRTFSAKRRFGGQVPQRRRGMTTFLTVLRLCCYVTVTIRAGLPVGAWW